MSRIGKLPVVIPDGVTITMNWTTVKVAGPKWELSWNLPEGVVAKQEESQIVVSIVHDKLVNMRWLSRTLIFNMVEWVTKWYEKKLQVLGVGYSVKVQWKKVVLNLWYSHPIDHQLPEGIEATVEKDPKWNDLLVLQWIDKQLVGEQAAKIRAYRKPEPYKGKWVRYLWEYVRMKAGKTATKK